MLCSGERKNGISGFLCCVHCEEKNHRFPFWSSCVDWESAPLYAGRLRGSSSIRSEEKPRQSGGLGILEESPSSSRGEKWTAQRRAQVKQ